IGKEDPILLDSPPLFARDRVPYLYFRRILSAVFKPKTARDEGLAVAREGDTVHTASMVEKSHAFFGLGNVHQVHVLMVRRGDHAGIGTQSWRVIHHRRPEREALLFFLHIPRLDLVIVSCHEFIAVRGESQTTSRKEPGLQRAMLCQRDVRIVLYDVPE